jgi:hypothetical protein
MVNVDLKRLTDAVNRNIARIADHKLVSRIADHKLVSRLADHPRVRRIADHKLLRRKNVQAAGAVAAFALLVGLSAPVAALGESNGGESGQDQTIAAATVEAVTEAVAPPAAPVVAPTAEQMHPLPVTAEQQQFTPSPEQMSNAKAIVEAGKAMGLSPRAWTIAVATSLQESNLKNLGHLGERNDHDSQGLFQQRPSSGWGTVAQITDPNYSATAFYKALVEVDGWESMPLTRAAQKVQVSAYPDHYAKHEAQAGDIIAGLYGTGPYAGLAASVK